MMICLLSSYSLVAQSINKKEHPTKESTTELTGSVMYFFNKYQGNKPDIGSEIYIIQEEKLSDSSLNMISYFENNAYFIPTYYILRGYGKSNENDEKRITEIKEKFPNVDKWMSNFMYSSNINKIAKYIIKPNSIGNYSIQIKNGKYIMIIKSENRDYWINETPFDKCTSQINGGLFIIQFEINNNEYKNISCLFDISYSRKL